MHQQLIPKFKEIVNRYSKNYKITDSEKFVKIIIKDIRPRSNTPEHRENVAKNDSLTQDLLNTFKPYHSSGLRYSHNSKKKATTYIVHFRKAWQQVDNQDWIKQNDIVYDSEGADVDARKFWIM